MALSSENQRKVMTEFIELYKLQPCLWQIESKEYRNRRKKEAAYKKLVDKLKEIDPTTNKDAVVKKINNLRSNIRKEKKRYKESLKSAASADDVYHPKLWYYNLFNFLNDQQTQRNSTSNLNPEDEIISEYCLGKAADEPDSPCPRGPFITKNTGTSTEIENVRCSSAKSNTSISHSRPGKQKQNENSSTNDIFMTVRDHFKRPCIEEDRFDIVGKSVAIKLREADKRQSLIAEKIINDVIFEAELGNLTLNHKCVNMRKISDATKRNEWYCHPAVSCRQSV